MGKDAGAAVIDRDRPQSLSRADVECALNEGPEVCVGSFSH